MRKQLSQKTQTIFSIILYAIPIVFFAVSYFLLITTGEDIWQGAHTAPNIWQDMVDAFNHSARLADMYAWAVINFFDYHFVFGVDTIFRVIDLLAMTAILYLITSMILRRRPKLQLKDALIFCAIFVFFVLTSFGIVFYIGWSKIHNYLLIVLVSLLFGRVYLRDIAGEQVSKSKIFAVGMFVLGFLFGIMSNLTMIVFSMTMVAYIIYLKIQKRPIAVKKFCLSWRLVGIIGALIGTGIIFLVGSGVGSYETNQIYLRECDFVSFAQIFSDFFGSVGRIFLHTCSNFGRMIFPFLLVSVFVAIMIIYLRRKKLLKITKIPKKDKDVMFVLGAFVVMHLIAVSQIYYLERIVLPAYIAAVILYMMILKHIFKGVDPAILCKFLLPVVLTLSITAVTIRTTFAISYYARIAPILDDIKQAPGDTYCVDYEVAKSPRTYANLGQEDFLVDWAMPQTIYGKKIYFCK